MFGFCEKNKGAISVFLTLILLPTLLLGGLTTDAARIYMSKVVISDAGEMAMNAGLAQYETELHDEYGLFSMEKTPEDMEDDLADFFNKSLNGKGLDGTEDYDKILDLITENFNAYNVEGSQIYKSEVEKQQIVEYMKYRAPVCLTEELLGKLDDLKKAQLMKKAMVAQMDFGDAMEDCQDSMENALKQLDDLNAQINAFPDKTTIAQALERMKQDYQTTMSKCILMRAAIAKYNGQADGNDGDDVELLARSFIRAAAGVDVSVPYDQGSFESYMNCLKYQKAINAAPESLRDILKEEKRNEPDEEDASKHRDWEERIEKLEDLIDQYDSAKSSISGYEEALEGTAQEIIRTNTEIVRGYYVAADNAKMQSATVYQKLEDVEKKLEKAKEKWEAWKTAADALGDDQGQMEESVKEYGKFFGDGDDANDGPRIRVLMKAVDQDRTFFTEMSTILTKQRFFGITIVFTDAGRQFYNYYAKAKEMVGSDVDVYMKEEDIRANYMKNYQPTEISVATSVEKVLIENDPFYQRLKEYCADNTNPESAKKKEEANTMLGQTKDAGTDAQKEDGYPGFDWSSVDQSTLPSVVLAKGGTEDADAKMADVDGNVDNRRARKNAIAKFKQSMEASANFLEGISRIVEDNLENLYVAEYAMQMFSYYTIDKNKGEDVPADEIISMTGYKLQDRKAYKAEVEYILWGNSSSKTNVRNTVMTIFGIRMLLNSFFAFTNTTIVTDAKTMATAIAGPAPYLVPIIQALIQLGYAGLETVNDIQKIKDGYGVTIVKTAESWASIAIGDLTAGDNTKELSLNYREFLRIFLNINMLAGKEDTKLARIADCIQIDTDYDLLKGYTMLALEARVKSRTTFMRKLSDMGAGGWNQPDDTYPILYQSILGY